MNRSRILASMVLVALPAAAGAVRIAAADWPQWRGPHRDGVAPDTNLLESWPEDGPPLAWTASGIGGGYSSVAVAGERVFTLGDRDRGCHLVALARDGGKELWATRIGDTWSDGGPRSTPAVDGERVYALSPHGDLVCARADSGAEVWRKSLAGDLGGRMMSGWGYSESVLIDGDRLIATPGSDAAALAAFDKKTGEVIWKAAVPKAGGAGYASIIVGEAGGIRQYITVLGRSGGAIGVAAADGKLLWRHNRVAGGTANVPTPIAAKDLVFYSTGYDDGGSALLRLVRDGDGLRAEEVWVKDANELRNHHGGVVLVAGHLFGGHGQNNGLPFCVDLESGDDSWERQRGPGSGSAAVIYADGHLYFRYEDAVMALIEAAPEGYRLKSSFKIPQGKRPSWAHPAIAGGRLYLRDGERLLCYDIAEKGGEKGGEKE